MHTCSDAGMRRTRSHRTTVPYKNQFTVHVRKGVCVVFVPAHRFYIWPLMFVRQAGPAWPSSAAHYRGPDRANHWRQWAQHNITSHTHTRLDGDRSGTHKHKHTKKYCSYLGQNLNFAHMCWIRMLSFVYRSTLTHCEGVCSCLAGFRIRTFSHSEVIVSGARDFNERVSCW